MSPEFANKNLQVMQQQENHFATLKISLDNNRSRAATTTLSNTYPDCIHALIAYW
jgi:hypothetical protein